MRHPALLLILLSVCASGADDPQVVKPAVSTAPLVNPGKGWVSYHSYPPKKDSKEFQYASIGYTRCDWGSIQSDAEDRYDWKPIDGPLAAWDAAGKQLAFGVMSASTHSRLEYVTPKWVFDAGAKSTTVTIKPGDAMTGNPGTYRMPDFLDPVYMQKLDGFIAAMAKRYDGDRRIAFIDVRSFGNWGESYHESHVLLYAKHFKKTRICQSCDGRDATKKSEFCASRGIAVRRDGIGGSLGKELIPAIGRVPAIYEFWGPLDYLEQRKWWRNGDLLTESIAIGKPTYVEIIRGSPQFLKLHEDLVARCTNRIGFHFVLTEARIPARIAAGKPFPMSLAWLNQGVAPIYAPCITAVALIGKDDAVADTALVTGSQPAQWKPDTVVKENSSATFTSIAPGTYQFAIGLLDDVTAKAPSYHIGITTAMTGKWHCLGTVAVR
jgi:hypothetical protein